MLTKFEHFFKRIMLACECNTDTELAKFLKINKSTLSMWKKRESVDYEKLFTKIEPSVNIDWLISGRGSRYLDNSKAVMLEEAAVYGKNKDIKEIALNLSEVISNQQKEISDLRSRIIALENSKKTKTAGKIRPQKKNENSKN